MAEQKKARISWLDAVTIIGVLITLAALFYTGGRLREVTLEGPEPSVPVSVPEFAELRGEVARISNSTARLDAMFGTVRNAPAGNVDQAKLQASLDELNKRLRRIEDALEDDPQRALVVPLIRKDLDSLRATQEMNIAWLRSDLESLKQIIYAALGLAATTLAGLIVWVFQRKLEQRPTEG